MNGFELIVPFLRPIPDLILDPDISEIMLNGPEHVFIERAGRVEGVPGLTLSPKSLEVAVRKSASFWLFNGARNSKMSFSRKTCLAMPTMHSTCRQC